MPSQLNPLLQWLDAGYMQRAIFRISVLSWFFVWCLLLTGALALVTLSPLLDSMTWEGLFLMYGSVMALMVCVVNIPEVGPRGRQGAMVRGLGHAVTTILSLMPFGFVQDFGLFVAVMCDRKKAVRRHLRRGANINLCLPRQGSALHLAIAMRHYRMAHYLLSQGAQVDGICERYGDVLGIALVAPDVPQFAETIQTDKWLHDNFYYVLHSKHSVDYKDYPWIFFFSHEQSWYRKDRAPDRAVLRKIVRLRNQTDPSSRVGNAPLKAVSFLEEHVQCVRDGWQVPKELAAQFMGLFKMILEQQKNAPDQNYRKAVLARCARLQRRHAHNPGLAGLYGHIEAIVISDDMRRDTCPVAVPGKPLARL